MRKTYAQPEFLEFLAYLYEKIDMNDVEIVEYLKDKGIELSKYQVNSRLKSYYKQQGSVKPEKRLHRKLKTEKDKPRIIYGKRTEKFDIVIKIARLDYKGLSVEEMRESLKQEGVLISLNKLYDLLNKRNEWIGLLNGIRLCDDEVKEILMRGMTIEEFVVQYGQQDNEKEIREKFRKLRVVAEYSKRENGAIVPDNKFIRVLNLSEGSKEDIKKYNNINGYIVDGKLEKGKIKEMQDAIFHENADAMVYILTRLNMNLNKGFDEKIFNESKKEFLDKIDKYLRIMELVDNNIRKTQQKQLPLNLNGEER